MKKLREFVKNNKMLILSLVAILALSSFFREEIRTSRETLEKKELTITELREDLKQSELKVKELSESKEKEIQEVVIINADGSSKTIKNTKSKSKKNAKTLESKEIEKKIVKKDKKELDLKTTKEETVHKNPKKGRIYIFGGAGTTLNSPLSDFNPNYGIGGRVKIGAGFEVQADADFGPRKEVRGMINWGFDF